jgi:signal peptidase II
MSETSPGPAESSVEGPVGAESSVAASRSVPIVSLAIAALVVLLDQLTKHWAVSSLDDGRVVHVIWTLQFNLAFNGGMAFGRGDGLGPVIGVVALVVVVVLILSLKRSDSGPQKLAVGLIIGGALGNIVDRLLRGDGWLHGKVVDFIDFQWFAIFNIADACINIGGLILVIAYLRGGVRA